MREINQALKVYQSYLSNKIKGIANSLETCLGLDEFIYTYISNQGEFFVISTQPEPSEYYFSQHFYQSTLLIRHPDNYQNGALLPAVLAGEKLEPAMEINFGYAAHSLLAIFRRDKKGVHKFLFNRKGGDASIVSFYIRHMAVIECFCDYFLKEWQPYLKDSERYTIDIAALIGPDFYEINHPNQFQEELDQKLKFLKSIEAIPKDFMLSFPLSSQEKNCLELVVNGHTLKEAAHILGLSKRTVEYYFENIKNKMGCLTRSEVLHHSHHLKLLGIL